MASTKRMTPKEIKALREGLDRFSDENSERLERAGEDTYKLNDVMDMLASEEKAQYVERYVKITLRAENAADAKRILGDMFREAEESDCFGENWVEGEVLEEKDYTITKKQKAK